MYRYLLYSLLTMVWGIIGPCQAFSAQPQIFSSNLASENYLQSPQITANIIITHSNPITEVALNGIPQQIIAEDIIVLEEPLLLRPGKNRLLIEAKTHKGETATKEFLLYYGNLEELERWKSQHKEELETAAEKINYLLDLRLQYDDNALFAPLNKRFFRISQEETRRPNTDKKTYELLTDFKATYHPSTTWKWEKTPVSPELSYRFQSQWNSTLKESGYLSHWFSGRLIWELGNHRIDTKSSYIFLRTNTAKASWQDLAKLQVVEISGQWFHSKQFQSHSFMIFIDQDFNDRLDTVSEGIVKNGVELEQLEDDKGHDLDGVKQLLGYGFTYHILQSSQNINAILLHTTSDTRKNFDDYTALGGILKYGHPLKSYNSDFSLEGQYEKQNYQAIRTDLINESSKKKRSDDFIRLILGIQRSIDVNSQISASLIKAVNYSTLSVFDYQRNTANIGITLQF